jgi:hypothetical protein
MNTRGISIGNKNNSRRVAVAAVLGLALGLLPSAPAMSAEKSDLLNDRFLFTLGAYAVNSDTRVRFDGKTQHSGTPVDWERAFGGGTSSRVRVDAQWRFAERHKIRALWFNSSRSSQRTIDREIDWGGETFPVNAKVKGEISYDIYELAYEYAFMRRETFELSASIGAYYAPFDASLKATVTSAGGTAQNTIKGDASMDLPLPVLGARALWVLPYDLSLDVSGQWFTLSIDQYSGNLQDYRATLTWQPKKWLGIGAGYDWFQAHGDVDQTHFKGNLDWTFQGPMIYYSASF